LARIRPMRCQGAALFRPKLRMAGRFPSISLSSGRSRLSFRRDFACHGTIVIEVLIKTGRRRRATLFYGGEMMARFTRKQFGRTPGNEAGFRARREIKRPPLLAFLPALRFAERAILFSPRTADRSRKILALQIRPTKALMRWIREIWREGFPPSIDRRWGGRGSY